MTEQEKIILYEKRERKYLLKEIISQFRLKKGDMKKIRENQYHFKDRKGWNHLLWLSEKGKGSRIDAVLYKYIVSKSGRMTLTDLMIIEVKVRETPFKVWKLERSKMNSIDEVRREAHKLCMGLNVPPNPKAVLLVVSPQESLWFKIEPAWFLQEDLWEADRLNKMTARNREEKMDREVILISSTSAKRRGTTKNEDPIL